jgi:hypothetical protein
LVSPQKLFLTLNQFLGSQNYTQIHLLFGGQFAYTYERNLTMVKANDFESAKAA